MICTKCEMFKKRKCIVEGSGATPADVLFITDPPSFVEELTNDPLTGHAKTLLKSMIDKAEIPVSFYVVPVVMCRPTKLERMQEYVLKCQDNVEAVIRKVNPKLIVCLGDLSYYFYKNSHQTTIKMIHPNFILKSGGFNSPQYLPNRNKLLQKIKEVQNETFSLALG